MDQSFERLLQRIEQLEVKLPKKKEKKKAVEGKKKEKVKSKKR